MCFFLCCLEPHRSDNVVRAKFEVAVDEGAVHDENQALTTRRRPRYSAPQYKEVSRRQCSLLQFVWERNWDKVVRRCQSHPSEARCVTDSSGRTALHLATFNHGCPVYIAEVLIQANFHALIRQDRFGYTPLHQACGFQGGTDDVIPVFCQKIVELHALGRDTSISEEQVPSPLQLACKRNISIEVLQALLSTRDTNGPDWIAPVTGGEPYWDSSRRQRRAEWYETTPLSALLNLSGQNLIGLDSITKRRMSDVAHATFNWNNEEPNDISHTLLRLVEDDNDMLILWTKCLLLLRYHLHQYSHVDGNDSGSLLHLVASLHVSAPALAECCAQVFSDDLLVRDAQGYVPLHHALHALADEIVSILVRHEPRAVAMALPNGQSPLVVAIERHLHCLGDMVKVDPDVLTRRDPPSRLYPFQVAASVNADLSTIFYLVRLRPDLIEPQSSSSSPST